MAKSDAKTGKGEGNGSSDNEVVDDPIRLDKRSLATEEPEAEPAPTEVAGTQEVGVEFAGAAGAEELSDLISQTGGDEGNSELEALEPSTTRKGREDYDDLNDNDGTGDGIVSFEDRMNQGSRPDGLLEGFGSGSGGDDDASSKSMFGGGGSASGSQSTVGGGGGSSSHTSTGTGGGGGDDQSHTSAGGGVGSNPVVNPITGEGESDPMSSFTDYAETKTGGDESLDPGGGPAPGSGRSVADGDGTVLKTVSSTKGNTTTTVTVDTEAGEPVYTRVENKATGITVDNFDDRRIVTDKNNGTVTTVKEDGSTVTRTLGGTIIDSTGPLKDPGPDAPYRATLDEKANDPLFRQYEESKNAGGGGDGTTDPAEHEDSMVLDGAITREQIEAQRLGQFGQPAGEDFTGERDTSGDIAREWNDDNMGALDPADGFGVGGGSRLTENEADAVTTREPAAGMPDDGTEEQTADTTGGGGESTLPDYDILRPVDDPSAEVPDYIDAADVP